MANLKNFKRDTAAIADGEWIDVGMGDDQFRIKTRGFTAAYKDTLAALKRQAARTANRAVRPGQPTFTPDTLPPTVDDQCQGEALADCCVLGVEGLTDGERAVTTDEFRAMLKEPEVYTGLLFLALGAAMQVGAARDDQTKAAVGNSAAPSTPSSTAAESEAA